MLELGDDASTDSGWGGSSSDEAEESGERKQEEAGEGGKGRERRSPVRSSDSDSGVEDSKGVLVGDERRCLDDAGGSVGGAMAEMASREKSETSTRRQEALSETDPKPAPHSGRSSCSPRESDGTGGEGVPRRDDACRAGSKTVGFLFFEGMVGDGVDAAQEAKDSSTAAAAVAAAVVQAKGVEAPGSPSPRNLPLHDSLGSALEYSGSALGDSRQAGGELGAVESLSNVVGGSGGTAGGQVPTTVASIIGRSTVSGHSGGHVDFARVNSDDDDEDYRGGACRNAELRSINFLGAGGGGLDPFKLEKGAGERFSTTAIGGTIVDGAARSAGVSDSCARAREGAGERCSGSFFCGETVAADRLDIGEEEEEEEEESRRRPPMGTRDGLWWSGERKGGALSSKEEQGLWDRLRERIGSDSFLDACR